MRQVVRLFKGYNEQRVFNWSLCKWERIAEFNTAQYLGTIALLRNLPYLQRIE